MTNDETKAGDLTVVAIPADKAQAVIDFVESLTTEETDVTGHMLSTGAVGGISGSALSAKKGRTLSGCWQTGSPAFGTDWSCSDTDPA
jgi:hypothetical protein